MHLNLGLIVTSPAIKRELSQDALTYALRCHQEGNWGEISDKDKKVNIDVLARGFPVGNRILSKYTGNGGLKFYVVTEKSDCPGEPKVKTTICREEDY